MREHRGIVRVGLVALLAVSLLVLPSGLSIGGGRSGALAQDLFPTVPPPEATFLPPFTASPGPSAAMPTVAIASGFSSGEVLPVTINGDTIVIGNRQYTIGDPFMNAEGIPLAAIEQSMLGDYGYATLLTRGGAALRLIWVAERSGGRRYMIVRETDTLFSGADGFKDQLADLHAAESHMRRSIGALLSATGTVVAIDLGLCPATLGATCAKAAFTALLGGVGAAGASLWYLFGEVVPAQRNVVRAFVNLDINLP